MNRKKKFFVSVVAVVLLLSNGMTAFAGVSYSQHSDLGSYDYLEEGLTPVVVRPSPYEDVFLESYQFNIYYSVSQERPEFYSPITAPWRSNPTRALFLYTDRSSKPDDPPYDNEYRYEYDERGNLTVVTDSNSKGTFFEIHQYTYDEQDRLLSETRTRNMGGSGWSNPSTTQYTYDANGNLLSEVWDGHSNKWTYDAQGNLSSGTFTDSDGSVTYKYTRDAQGNLLQSTCSLYGDKVTHTLNYDEWGLDTDYIIRSYNPGSYEEHRYTYDYDGTGSNLYLWAHDITDYVEEGNFKEIQYTYDEMGNVTTHFFYNSFYYELETDELTYDAAGRLLTHVNESEPLQDSLIVIPNYFDEQYIYDEMGNLATYAYHGYVGFDKRPYWFKTYQYTYDAMGNLLTCTYTSESKSGTVTQSWQFFYD
ncbi:MAG: hypothetical protein NC254_05050 [bacterium]|nr:hypothetical protein [bacterium]